MPGLKRKRTLAALPATLTEAQVTAMPEAVSGVVPQCRWLKITPELAMKWLDLAVNHKNRTIREAHVRQLASDMTEGRWRGRNGEAIRFDSEGRLVDGQHRLWACFLSGMCFESLVINNVSPEDYSTIGVGAKKSLADFLGPNYGEKNVHLLASSIRIVYLWRHGLLGATTDGGGRHLPSIAQMEITFRDNPNLRESVNIISSMQGLSKLFNGTFASLIHYAGTLDLKSASVQSFMDRLADGLGLEADDPVYFLRQFLLSQQTTAPSKRRAGRQYVLALAIKSWNYSKRGARIKTLRLRVDEPFPIL